MPIAEYRSEAKTGDGKPVYIIRTKNPISRKMLGVVFINGEGRTKFKEKAMRFDEEFGYEVILPKGERAWKLASSERTVYGTVYGEEDLSTEVLEDDE